MVFEAKGWLLALLLAAPVVAEDVPVGHRRELRGAWVASVANMNFPSRAGLSAEEQQQELRSLVDCLAEARFNAVFFHVRPEGDALYASDLEPWSLFLTGQQGQNPGYDPLATLLEQAHQRGIEVHVLPATATIDDVLAVGEHGPDGLFYSNGPGDPAATTHQIELLRAALERRLPYFGICFGNQLFGRALGLGTYKPTYGHRGINQPVMDRTTGKVEVTAHNHGFAVAWPDGVGLDQPVETPYGTASVSHVCLNDDVVEGIELRAPDSEGGALRGFSVQYHPEAAAGPHDAAYLFDRFCDLMAGATEGSVA